MARSICHISAGDHISEEGDMSLIGISIKLERIDESLLYRTRGRLVVESQCALWTTTPRAG